MPLFSYEKEKLLSIFIQAEAFMRGVTITNYELSITNYINAILVPQGAEYKSVCACLNRVAVPTPPVFPIPIGTSTLTKYLEKWQQAGNSLHPQSRVLLMGLCGSLSPQYGIGDVVLYQRCVYPVATSSLEEHFCDLDLTARLQQKLKERVFMGIGLTSDRLIYAANEKRYLGQVYGADVVDMEGFAALEVLSRFGVAVSMLRVVSDDIHHNIPNLTNAFNPDGSLQASKLAIGLLRQPIAATRLILGAMRGLQVLQNVTTFLFTE